MKLQTLIAIALISTAQLSHALEFSLNCKDEKSHRPVGVTVVKVPVKKDGKWDANYFIDALVIGGSDKPMRFSLEPISGDEDYTEYEVKANGSNKLNVMAVYIQKDLKWASLVNQSGSSFARCEK